LVPTIAALVCASALFACGGKSKRDDLWWADKHAPPTATSDPAASTPRSIGVLTAKQAATRLRAELAKPTPRPFYAIVYANRLGKAGGSASTAQAAQLRRLISGAGAETLQKAWPELDQPHAPARLVALRLALLAHHSGDDARARRMLKHAGGNPSIAAIVATLQRQLAATAKVDAHVIAVLLPLSGRYRKLGREMRLAIVVAAGGVPGTRLEFIDTAGDASRAVAAVDQAVFKYKAAAILGPVGQAESIAAARRAVARRIPIALLSPGSAGAAPRAGVFRLWSSPRWEGREAARLAISLGYTKLAVLAPRGDVGKAQAAAFAQAAAAGRAKVVRSGFYSPARTAIEKDIKAFLHLDPKTNRRLRRYLARHGWKRGWRSYSPRIPFDLLYIPDGYKRAALIAAYMPYFNVEVRTSDAMNIALLKQKHGGRFPRVVQLFGSSAWHHPGLITRGGKSVQGAMVVDVYSGSDTEEYAYEAGAAFAQTFNKRVGRNPGAVAAQTYDAAMLLFRARARAATSRGQVRMQLARELRQSRYDGACGPAIVDSNGEIRRRAIMLRVDGGDFVPHAH